ncbi:MAG TPA: PepSY domain-containing protein [Candidatus Nitrosotalea sp.]|nr:PepSY domain-containing protein [Candidatus Nitrosotalea sp.]
MSVSIISENQARDIAVEFLRQHNLILTTEKPTLADNVWHVIVIVTSPARKRIEVLVNAKSGYVEGFLQK